MGDRPEFRDTSTISAFPSNSGVLIPAGGELDAALFSALPENDATNGLVWVATADWDARVSRY
jgi:hypothetical protein